MKTQPDGWYVCDWCGGKFPYDDFHFTGLLDMCKTCAMMQAGRSISSIRERLEQAELSIAQVARLGQAVELVGAELAIQKRCEDCGELIEEILCPTCQCGVWYSARSKPADVTGPVLVYTAANNWYVARWMGDRWHVRNVEGGCLSEDMEVVTHWRHLPPHPKSEEPFFMAYSGFTTGSPVNIVARDGPVFQIHAENGEEVQRLVAYLNEQHRKEDNT